MDRALNQQLIPSQNHWPWEQVGVVDNQSSGNYFIVYLALTPPKVYLAPKNSKLSLSCILCLEYVKICPPSSKTS